MASGANYDVAPRPCCGICRQPLVLGQTKEFRLLEKRWYTCIDCAPIAMATATAAAEGVKNHIAPAMVTVAKNTARRFLDQHPVLRSMLAGAVRGYEQGVTERGDTPGEPRRGPRSP